SDAIDGVAQSLRGRMQVDLCRASPRVAQQFLSLVQRASSVQDVRGESVSQLVRMYRARQARSPRQPRQQLVDRTRAHRRPQWRVEQVDQHEIAVTSLST